MKSKEHRRIPVKDNEMRAALRVIVSAAVLALAGCGFRGLKPLPSAEEAFTDKRGAGSSEVKVALDSCGYKESMSASLKKGETLDNARACVMECMFSKGFYCRDGWEGMCSVPEYSAELPACENAPHRPRYHYYGQ